PNAGKICHAHQLLVRFDGLALIYIAFRDRARYRSGQGDLRSYLRWDAKRVNLLRRQTKEQKPLLCRGEIGFGRLPLYRSLLEFASADRIDLCYLNRTRIAFSRFFYISLGGSQFCGRLFELFATRRTDFEELYSALMVFVMLC